MITNKNRNVLYCGVTNNLQNRLFYHGEDTQDTKNHFSGKYNCKFLIYYERFDFIDDAINREKQIKGWSRKKKEDLIRAINPEWRFLNDEINES